MDLHSAGHRRGVAAAPHHAAAEAGRAVLAEGGNALEAMVAMAATIAAVYPHMNHIGGDGFWLFRERSGRVRALMAAGRARAGTDAFYGGDAGRELPADLAPIDSPVTRADPPQSRAAVAEPLSVTLEANTPYNPPPPTQGLASLIVLALFERLRVAQAESFEHIHGLVEATKRAFRVRDRVITDPARLPAPPERFLDR